MPNGAALDVLISVTATFVAVSLLCGLLTEVVARILQYREKTLRASLGRLLDDPNGTALARELYRHPLINPFATDAYFKQDTLQPADISPAQFADALLQIVRIDPGKDMEQAVLGASEFPLSEKMKYLLIGMIHRSHGDFDKVREELRQWYSLGSRRIQRIYSERMQIFGFAIGLVIAVLLNIDIFQIATASLVRSQLDLKALCPNCDAADMYRMLRGLPALIGWSSAALPSDPGDAMLKMVGWLITASSALIGWGLWLKLLLVLLRAPDQSDRKNDDKD